MFTYTKIPQKTLAYVRILQKIYANYPRALISSESSGSGDIDDDDDDDDNSIKFKDGSKSRRIKMLLL